MVCWPLVGDGPPDGPRPRALLGFLGVGGFGARGWAARGCVSLFQLLLELLPLHVHEHVGCPQQQEDLTWHAKA